MPHPSILAQPHPMLASPSTAVWQTRRLARFCAPPVVEPLLQDWLKPSRDALFRWTMSMAVGDEGRRAIAELAVAIQRLRGPEAFCPWLYGAALQAAVSQRQGLPEGSLTGLPPELRALLRLVTRGELRREEAMALLAQRMDVVRSRLVHTRLARQSALAPLDDARSDFLKSV